MIDQNAQTRATTYVNANKLSGAAGDHGGACVYLAIPSLLG